MNKRRFRRAVFLTGFVGLLLVGGYGLWLFQAQRNQYALDRQLIAALVKSDIVQGLALVKDGADPNAPHSPPPAPTLQRLFDFLFRRSSLLRNDSPTAILIACGDHWGEGEATLGNFRDAPQLVQTMLEHGANIETKDQEARKPLLLAIEDDKPQTVRVLLEHGADTNTKSKNGETPLQAACLARSSEYVRVLLEHGANANALDDNGTSVLCFAVMCFDPSPDAIETKDIILHLLKHGADPNLSTKGVNTALELAQSMQRPDLVALLRKTGAKR